MIRALSLLLLMPVLSAAQEVTYYKDVAPIIIENCLPCHRKGEVAPFPLESYRDVANKARLVEYVTKTRYMPPWIADPDYRRYGNERLLTAKEINTIKTWVKQGKKEGNKAHMPKVPSYQGSSLMGRKPDMVLEMPEAHKIPGTNEETFMVVKFPGSIPEEKSVEAIEFIPGNRKMVHHVNFFVYDIPEGIDYFKGKTIMDHGDKPADQVLREMNMSAPGKEPEMLYYAGWVPGMSPQVFHKNFGIKLPKRFVILANTMHYSFSPVPETDRSKFHIYFKDEEVERTVDLINLGSGGGISEIVPPLTLQPNRIQRHVTTAPVPLDISVMYAAPHMHLFGKSYIAYAITPLKDTIPLINIPKWDFNWQEMYRFDPMVYLPKGSVIRVEGIFDNTVRNPNNPYNPPKTIYSTGNMGTLNEMLNIVILFTKYRMGDEKLKLE